MNRTNDLHRMRKSEKSSESRSEESLRDGSVSTTKMNLAPLLCTYIRRREHVNTSLKLILIVIA